MFRWFFSRRDPPHPAPAGPKLWDPYVVRVAVPDAAGGWTEYEVGEFDCGGRAAARRAVADLAARVGQPWPLVARMAMPGWLRDVRRAVWASGDPGRCEVRAYGVAGRGAAPAFATVLGGVRLVPA